MLTARIGNGSLTVAEVIERVFGKTELHGQHEDCSVHVIPQKDEPRWIIIGSPRKALPVLRSWAPWKTASRIRWNAVRLSAALNTLSAMPRVANSSERVDLSYWRSRFDRFPAEWNAVIHVGNPSHTRKAILFLIDKGERVVCAGKIPISPQSAEAILHEGAMLELLAGSAYLPDVLFVDRVRGVVAQSWLEGSPVSRGFTQAHLDLVSSLATSGRSVRVSDSLAQMSIDLEDVDFPFDRSVVARALEMLGNDFPLNPFVVHGDFAPWNLKWIRPGRLGLLDWEWAVPHGLPWQDICRFFYLDDAHFRGSGKVWAEINGNELLQRYLRTFDIPGRAIAPLTMRYLLGELLMEWKAGNQWLADYAYRQIVELIEAVSDVKGRCPISELAP